jgi:hypothetical protein
MAEASGLVDEVDIEYMFPGKTPLSHALTPMTHPLSDIQ